MTADNLVCPNKSLARLLKAAKQLGRTFEPLAKCYSGLQ